MLACQDISIACNRKVLGNAQIVGEKNICCANGHKVVGCLDGSHTRSFTEHLFGSFLSFFDGRPSMENQTVVWRNLGFEESPPVAFQSFLGRGRYLGASEKSDSLMAQFYQVASDQKAAVEIVGLHIRKLRAKRGVVAQDNRGHPLLHQFVVDHGRGSQSIDRRDKEPIDAPGEQSANASFLAFG